MSTEPTAPWRNVEVVEGPYRHHALSGRQRDTLGYWVLTLDCGHVTERNGRRADNPTGRAAPPTKVRCEDCLPHDWSPT